ncbi:MAG: hypothetical protein WKF30_03980 [Pyrinomonadaceae bacterium]
MPKAAREVSLEDAAKRVAACAGVRFIDVREDNEWTAGHARGAEHLGRGVIERDVELKVPDKETELFFIAAAVIVRRWPRIRYRKWATRMFTRWPEAGRRGLRPGCRLRLTRLNRISPV